MGKNKKSKKSKQKQRVENRQRAAMKRIQQRREQRMAEAAEEGSDDPYLSALFNPPGNDVDSDLELFSIKFLGNELDLWEATPADRKIIMQNSKKMVKSGVPADADTPDDELKIQLVEETNIPTLMAAIMIQCTRKPGTNERPYGWGHLPKIEERLVEMNLGIYGDADENEELGENLLLAFSQGLEQTSEEFDEDLSEAVGHINQIEGEDETVDEDLAHIEEAKKNLKVS